MSDDFEPNTAFEMFVFDKINTIDSRLTTIESFFKIGKACIVVALAVVGIDIGGGF